MKLKLKPDLETVRALLLSLSYGHQVGVYLCLSQYSVGGRGEQKREEKCE